MVIYTNMRFLFFPILAALLLCAPLHAQNTKVKGRVTDAETGEPIPFANVFFDGTTIGVSTDMDGNYHIDTRQETGTILKISTIGYEERSFTIKPHSFNQVDAQLKSVNINLGSIVVKPDDSYVRSLLKKIQERRQLNDPEEYDKFSCKTYTKMELDLTNLNRTSWKNKKMQKNFGFVFNYMDTSAISGKAFLPVMISESDAEFYHSKEPEIDREVLKASRISGLEEDYSWSQFTGQIHAKVNFYENYINLFNISFASPLSGHGTMFYNYFIIDSSKVDGRKVYKIRFHPKMKSAAVLDGEMIIDAQTMGLKEAHASMPKGVNVNWIRDLVLDSEYERIPKDGDSVWFHKQHNLYADFSISTSDSTRIMSFLGRRQINYGSPDFESDFPAEVLNARSEVIYSADIMNNDPSYWEAARPHKLSERELNIYNMVDSIKQAPLYKDIYTLIETITTGYYETKYIGFGPFFKVFSFNNMEGARFQLGVRTNKNFSKKVRLTLYGAYGTKDREWKGGGSVELMFNKQPTRMLTFSYKRDVLQLGTAENIFAEGNLFGSIFARGNNQKLSYLNSAHIIYDHEFMDGVDGKFSLNTSRMSDSDYVPMVKPDGSKINAVYSTSAKMVWRFSWDETVQRGHFQKRYLYSSYPIITIGLSYAPKGILNADWSYFRADGKVNYKFNLSPLGESRAELSFGKIFGNVPFPLLKIHEGNGTFFYNNQAFSCMEYYEFASDTWVQLRYSHNFMGFFLGKIPLLKRLKLREVVSLNVAYGSLSHKNNGMMISEQMPWDNPTPEMKEYYGKMEAPLLFPYGMKDLRTPYVEMGVGITNILKIMRVDCFWRLTHRTRDDGTKPTNFTVNVGFDFRF